ncbi:MAG: V-type ATP synthase subunit E family protein [Thermoplasmata archaeon]
MSLDKLVEEILERGRRESEEILASADQERERMLSEVRARGEELLKEREAEAKDRASREKLREIARADLESKKIALQAQKEVLDEVLNGAKERIRSLGSKEELIRILVEKYRDEIASGVVHCNKQDSAVLRKLVKGEVRDDLDGIGGFIIESKDGTRRIDLTYETFLEDLWEDLIREIADLLWKER